MCLSARQLSGIAFTQQRHSIARKTMAVCAWFIKHRPLTILFSGASLQLLAIVSHLMSMEFLNA
jgi:hypothetical protein